MVDFQRFLKAPASSFFLFGPRGTGKSTWLADVFPEAIQINLLLNEDFREYSSKPERIREKLEGMGDRVVVIDEVQRVPELLSEVHSLIEQKRGFRFVLTGSSSRKLKRTGVDMLGGRAVLCRMHPFMASELGPAFNLDRALRLGLLPLVWSSPEPEKTLKGYAGLYLNEEVKMEGLVRRVGDFARFLEVMAFSHGAVLNLSNVSRECGINRKTVESHVSILEDLLLGFRIPVFTRRAKRVVIAHEKFYYFDAGIYRSLRLRGPEDRSEEMAGGALEGLLAQHLRAWVDYSENDAKLSYWRTPSGTEVDFVVHGPGIFDVIEIKNTPREREKDLKPLRAFKADYPRARACFLYRGKERFVRHGISILPVKEFLSFLVPGKPLPIDA